jgi:3-dehydroquinate dehydratase-2
VKILVLHGPNLQLLGRREPDVYGLVTLDGITAALEAKGVELGVEIESVQSNHEGELVSLIGASDGVYAGILINPAAYTHTSVALFDALRAVDVPAVEVHLSNTAAREDFRHRSLTAPACVGQITGFGVESYLLGLAGLIDFIKRERS